jgi:hypothetical protein
MQWSLAQVFLNPSLDFIMLKMGELTMINIFGKHLYQTLCLIWRAALPFCRPENQVLERMPDLPRKERCWHMNEGNCPGQAAILLSTTGLRLWAQFSCSWCLGKNWSEFRGPDNVGGTAQNVLDLNVILFLSKPQQLPKPST